MPGARRGSAPAGRRRGRGRSTGRGAPGRRSPRGRRRVRVVPAADRDRLLDQPRRGVRQHRPPAQGLLDRGRQVVVAVVGVELVHEACQHVGRAREPLEGPGELRGGGLVPGHEQRHQLVAKLLVGHRRAVLVAGCQQHREHVVAVRGVLARGARRSARRAARRSPRGAAGSSAQGPRPPSSRCMNGSIPSGRAPSVRIEVRRSRIASRRAAGIEPEHGAQDHLERQRLEQRVELHRPIARPARRPRARPPRP